MSAWQNIARKYASRYGLGEWFVNQMGQEAHGQDLTSPAGAQGPAQIMPATARSWGVRNPHDINQAYDAAARHMAQYVKQLGGVKNALVAYNAGPGAVGKQLPKETQNYIATILRGQNPGASVTPQRTPSLPGISQPAKSEDRYGRFMQTIQKLNTAAGMFKPPSFTDAYGQQQDNTGDELDHAIGENWNLINKKLQSQFGDQRPGSAITTTGSQVDGVRSMLERATSIDRQHKPYLWGGGHGARPTLSGPWDCSGAVSAVLGVNPRVSGDFARWGDSGPGKHVSIYANGEHTFMEINGHFFGTSRSNPGGGAGWIPRSAMSPGYLKGFAVRHPKGL